MSPAVPLFACASLGAAVGLSAAASPFVWALLAAFAIAGAVLTPSRSLRAALVLAVAFLVAAMAGAVAVTAHERARLALPREGVLEGIIVDDSPGPHGRVLVLDVTGALAPPGSPDAPRALSARLRVALRGAAERVDVHAGDRVRVLGRVAPLYPADGPGQFDAALYGVARDLHGRLSVHDPARIAVIARGEAGAPLVEARAWLRTRLLELATPREAGLVLALLVGDTSTFDEAQHELYRRVGAGHLLAVSGLQVTLLALIFFALARTLALLIPALGRRSRARGPAVVAALVGVWLFVGLCGAPPSCVRAGGMATVGLGALLLDRRASAVDAFGLAGLSTVLLSPVSVLDPSFLLSYAAVLGLLVAVPPRGPFQPAPGSLRDVALRARAVVVGAVAAGLCTLPISAHLFGELAPGGILANVVLVPAAATLQVPALACGLLGAALGSSVLVEVGAACAGVLEALCEGLGELVGVLVTLTAPGPVVAVGLTAAMVLLAAGLARARWSWALLGLALAGAVLAPTLVEPGGVRITVLPVGQGDGAVFELPDGTVFVVDGGGVWDEHRDPGEEVVTPFLRRRGIERVDVVALSHPDPDHVLGLLSVLRAVEVGEVWHPGQGDEHPLTRRLLALAAERGVPVRTAAEVFGAHRYGEVVVEVLAPRPEDGTALYDELTANDNSLVLRVGLGEDRALWPGDLEEWGERYLLRDGPDVTATVLKAPHHGSKTSSSPLFLDAVRPRHVVFPTGRDNAFGFPHAPVVERYRERGVTLWDTAVHGEITIWLTGEGVVIEPFRSSPFPAAHPVPPGAAGDPGEPAGPSAEAKGARRGG